jgi:hypothetical protein
VRKPPRPAIVALVFYVSALCSCWSGGHRAHAPATVPGRAPTLEQVRGLIEGFEQSLSAAYAAGDRTRLAGFLAGPQLQGNVATIDVLDARHQRNIFHVQLDSVSIASATPDRVVVNLRDHTTDDYFVDTTTGQTLNGGLPGPEAQSFIIFVDRNPANGNWYWTGAQKQPT